MAEIIMYPTYGNANIQAYRIILLVACVVILFYFIFTPSASANPGYTFTSPADINLGNMSPSAPANGNSSGILTGDNTGGYTVKVIDGNSGTNKGQMVSGSYILANKLQIGNDGITYYPADTTGGVTLYDGSGPVTDVAVPLFVSQTIAYNDVITTGYSMTITFTVTAK